MVLATSSSIRMGTGAPVLNKLPVRHSRVSSQGRCRGWRSPWGLLVRTARETRLPIVQAQNDEQEGKNERLKKITAENLNLRKRLRAKLANMQESEKAAFLAKYPDLTKVDESIDATEAVVTASTDHKQTCTTTEANGFTTYHFKKEEDAEVAQPVNNPSKGSSPPARDESSPGLTAGGRGGRFHMGVYSFSTSMVEEAGGTGPKKKKDNVEEDNKDADASPKPTVHETQATIAQSTVNAHVPQKAVKGKGHWLYFMVPEIPVAGADVVVYYNKAASDSLRHSSKVQIQVGYNLWELENSQPVINLQPAAVSREDESDWWSAQFPISSDGYEMNFIFSDGEGSYDNNDGKDFLASITGPMTPELWEEGAAGRAAVIFKARMKAEQEAALDEEKRRREIMVQQDLERAQWRIGELQGQFDELRKGSLQALTSMAGDISWKTRPSPVSPDQKATILYNTKSGPLSFLVFDGDDAPTIKYGFNGWKNPQESVMKRSSLSNAKEMWWEAEVDVQVDAVVINFVVQFYEHFDNNQGSDHKILVGKPGLPSDAWFQALLPKVQGEEEASRIKFEKHEAELKARRELMRTTAREKTMDVSRRQIKHVLFTEPQVVKAGDVVEVFYSSNNTCLNGKEQIYMIGGWNRWKHKKPFGPIKMSPPGPNGAHWQASVKVPVDAYKMDFVFSDVNGGDGTYDNRGGYDYHLPVEGGVAEEPPLHIVHVAVEMAPIAKVGGLGDVVTSLARAVKEQGHLVEIVLPRYEFFSHSPMLNNMVYDTEFDWGGCRIYVCSQIVEGLRVFFVEPKNGFFDTQSVYGRNDDAMRFEFFCKAALEFLLQSGRQPDILHCHDWSTADVASSYWNSYHHSGLWRPKVVFTIHNLNYGQAKISEAAMHSQMFTTVSPTYALEVRDNPTISSHVDKFMGIRNGIDMDLWDPETDQFLPMGYTPDTVVEGKAAARKSLSDRLGIAGWRDAPLIGVISRLTAQKGVHLIKHSAWRTVDRGGIFVLLGSAPDPKIQGEFDALAGSMGGENAAFYFAYDEPLSHLIYAACDMIVVPSIFEPCGLTQMIAMRYGSIPIVRSTGGLHDTVFDVDHDKPRAAWDMEGSSDWSRDSIDETNGFSFEGTDAGALDSAMNRAIDAFYNDRTWFHRLQKRVMLQDWSWNRPALDYIELYYATLKR